MESREEVTDAVTRGRRLLLLNGKRRPLAAFEEVFLTGNTVSHRMPLPLMHPLMRLDAELAIEPLATHVARVAEHFLVN